MKRYLLLYLATMLFSVAAHAQDVSLTLNLLPLAEGTVNLGVGYALKDNLTAELSGSVRPWARSETAVNKYWTIRPEIRYWTCQKYNGHFFGGYLTGSQFNVGGKTYPFGLFSSIEKHRFEGWTIGTGLTYGYHFLLSRNWNLEAGLGVGYNYANYKKFVCPLLCSRVESEDDSHYFGLTKLSLAIVYLF